MPGLLQEVNGSVITAFSPQVRLYSHGGVSHGSCLLKCADMLPLALMPSFVHSCF